MSKPLLALVGIAILGSASVAGVLVLASTRGEDRGVSQVETATAVPIGAKDPTGVSTVGTCDPRATPPPGKQLWRWHDLTVLLPTEGFRAFPQVLSPSSSHPNGGSGLNTMKYDSSGQPTASVLIDAETGAIVHSAGFPEHGKADGIAICPFDPATAPWPYNGDPPPESTIEAPTIQPDPGSGMYVEFTEGSGGYRGVTPTPPDCDRVGEAIAVHNWRSSAFIGKDAKTGSICKNVTLVQAEDIAAFERFLDRVELCVYQNAEC